MIRRCWGGCRADLFLIPSIAIMHAHRERIFPWGYGHILIFTAISATGVGLHVAASF